MDVLYPALFDQVHSPEDRVQWTKLYAHPDHHKHQDL
jgi:hypothetical protein